MNIELFRKYMTSEYLMGPNSVRILEELIRKYPLNLTTEDKVLDLGCGKGLSSYVIACETPAKIYACDLWITSEENAVRLQEWGIHEQVIPVRENANALHFNEKMFQAMVSIDAYHYFGTENTFFSEKILPFLNEKAVALIGIPGVKNAYSGRSQELLSAWLGDEAYMFRSPTEWKEIIGAHERIESVEMWEMECFDRAWSEWFDTGHPFALEDQKIFESLIKPYTCFVGIHIKLK